MSALKSTDLIVNMEKSKNALGKRERFQRIKGGALRPQKAKFILQVSLSLLSTERTQHWYEPDTHTTISLTPSTQASLI